MAVASRVESIGAGARARVCAGREAGSRCTLWSDSNRIVNFPRGFVFSLLSLCSPMKKEGKTCQKIAFLSIKCTRMYVCVCVRARIRLY